MKKIQFILILILLLPGLCFAANGEVGTDALKQKDVTKQISIQGGYDSVASINIKPIAVQAEGFRIGMPFVLNDPSVLANEQGTQQGRLIANWNILTNGKVLLDITAEVMHNYTENNTSDPIYQKGLGYKLTFVYNLSYFSGKEVFYIKKASFDLDVPSNKGKSVTLENYDLLKGIVPDDLSLVGSAEGEIYFSFDSAATNTITNYYGSLLDGNYSAIVTMTLKAKDK